MDQNNGSPVPSDALVVFGVTGDLAHKMIFPALYALAKRGVLTIPVRRIILPAGRERRAAATAVAEAAAKR